MIRFVFRVLFLVAFLGGLGGGIVYPSFQRGGEGYEIGHWNAYARNGGFKPVDIFIGAANIPFLVSLEITLDRPLVLSSGGAILTTTVGSGGATLLAAAVDVGDLKPLLVNPQSSELVAKHSVGVVDDGSPGTYRLTVGPGDAEVDKLASVDIYLHTAKTPLEVRAQPIGLAVMAVGFIGFVLTWRRGSERPKNPNSQPPPPRWGRGGRK